MPRKDRDTRVCFCSSFYSRDRMECRRDTPSNSLTSLAKQINIFFCRPTLCHCKRVLMCVEWLPPGKKKVGCKKFPIHALRTAIPLSPLLLPPTQAKGDDSLCLLTTRQPYTLFPFYNKSSNSSTHLGSGLDF